jgi:hypothetical protein
MSLFGPTVPPGPDGERPASPVRARPPTPGNRSWAVVLVAALAVVLVVNVVHARLVEQDSVTTQTTLGRLIDVLGFRPEDIALTPAVSRGMGQTQTDPAAWAHVSHIRVISKFVVVEVHTGSKAVVERVCKQARRYMYSPNPYGPKLRYLLVSSYPERLSIGLDGKNDACVAHRPDNP